MEVTEEMLRNIAGTIVDLQLKLALVRDVLISLGAQPELYDQFMRQALEGPEFEFARNLMLTQLRHGHP